MGSLITIIIKLFDNIIVYVRSFMTHIVLSPTWNIDFGVKFLGPIYRRSYGGKVIVKSKTIFGPWVNIDCARGGTIRIGKNVSLNFGTTLVCRQSIEIQDNVRIGELVSIRDNDHTFASLETPIYEQGYDTAPIIIKEGAWIGRSAVIMPGITIGKGAIVGANAVVTKSVPDFKIAAGVPAKVIRSRVDHGK